MTHQEFLDSIPNRPATIFFFPNGMAAVCNGKGEQMPEFQGNHAKTIELLAKVGIDWRDIPEILGSPLSIQPKG